VNKDWKIKVKKIYTLLFNTKLLIDIAEVRRIETNRAIKEHSMFSIVIN